MATSATSHFVALVRHPLGAFKNVPQGCRESGSLTVFSTRNAIAQSEFLQPLQQHDVEAIWLGDIQEHPAIAPTSVH